MINVYIVFIFGTDAEHEIRCLRKWIREMETRLPSLDIRIGGDWSLQELEEKAREHMVSEYYALFNIFYYFTFPDFPFV